MTKFTPSAWKRQGEVLESTANDFYQSAEGIVTAEIASTGKSPIDSAAHEGDKRIQEEWHFIVAGAYESMTAYASQMRATGEDYAASEEHAANQRFWQ